MSDENVVNLGVGKKFPVEQELFEKILDCIHEYDGDVSLVEVVGILDLAKDHVKNECS